jgi:hypothetical protein
MSIVSLQTVSGWLPDPAEMPEGYQRRPFADHLNTFTANAASASGDYDIPSSHSAYDQGGWGSCVANATLGAMNIVLEVQAQKTVLLSRFFLYWLCRELMGTKDQDSGTHMYMAVDRVGKVGACSEQTFPYVDANMFGGIDPAAYPEASDNKATAWFGVNGSGADRLDQLDASVRSNHPVIYGGPVGAAMRGYQKGQVLSIPDPTTVIGGHAMVVTGIRYINGQRRWRIRNSWSWMFGDDGHLLIDDDYMGWYQLRDFWLLSRMDPLLF